MKQIIYDFLMKDDELRGETFFWQKCSQEASYAATKYKLISEAASTGFVLAKDSVWWCGRVGGGVPLSETDVEARLSCPLSP